MSKHFDSRVEYAIDNIWLHPRLDNRESALRGLQEAAAEGDGDACYFLARCYSGSSFVEPGFGYQCDKETAVEWYNRSIELGSAVGMMGTMTIGNFTPRSGSYVHPPYTSEREVWNEVMEMARDGQGFCRCMIADAYCYKDAVRLAGLKIEGPADTRILLCKARQIYEELLQEDVFLGIDNMIYILISGEADLERERELAMQWEEKAAQMGVSSYEIKVGKRIAAKQPVKAMELYKSAAEHGNSDGYLELGKMYTYCSHQRRNLPVAKEYFEKAIEMNPNAIGPYNYLGEIYFKGGDGLKVDYQAAARCFLKVIDRNDWSSDMLGYSYLHGLGVPVDYARAKTLLEKYPRERLSCIGLGEIHAYGLGVPVNIEEAMRYWNRFSRDPIVKEYQKEFQETMWGWKRR